MPEQPLALNAKVVATVNNNSLQMNMMVCCVRLYIFVILSTQAYLACATNTTTLQLLVMLNLKTHQEDSTWTPRWNRGLELLPAAQLAVERINQDPAILAGYNLELTELDTGTCDQGYPGSALFQFVNEVTQEEQQLVGVVGAFCTTLAKAVALVAVRSGTNLLQILVSPSPALHDRVRYPHLFHIIPSSAVYGEAVCSLMEQFGWTRVGVVRDNSMEHFHSALVNMLGGNVAFYPFRGAPSLLRTLQRCGERVVILSVGLEEAAEVLCLAYKQSFIWPQLKHTWIVYEVQVEDFFHATSTCDNDTIRSALEGVFLIQYQLSTNDSNKVIVSGQTYWEYYDDYLQHLSQVAAQHRTFLNPNSYSNALHDSVWATAIALNASLQTIKTGTAEKIRNWNNTVLQTANNELSNVSFNGAVGNVDFDKNGESKVAVKIIQIRNGTSELYTVISDRQCNETATGRSQDDEIPRIHNLQSAAITAVLLTIEAVLIILTTVILILYLYHRNAPEIKATSPYLSLIMFLGCYFLFARCVIETISPYVIYDGVFFCSSATWIFGIGLHLIFGLLIMKMLRVYRIFTYFGKLGKRWSDGVLFAGVLAIVGAYLIFLTVLQVIGGSYGASTETLVTPEGSFPYYEVVQACSPTNIVAQALFECEVFLLIVTVVVLAILMRKIRRQHFKDTKKVNTFLYLDLLITYIFGPLPFIITNPETRFYLRFVTAYSTAILCQVFLFLPKVLPPLLRHLKLKYWKAIPKNEQSTTNNE